MTKNENDLKKASDLLRGVLNNTLDAEDALKQWPVMTYNSEKLLKNAYHLLQHFLTDEDIRARDMEYSAGQRGALEKFAADLFAESVRQSGI